MRNLRLPRLLAASLVLSAGMTVVLSSASPASATTLDATGTTFQFGVTGQTVTGAALDRALPAGSSILYSAVATISGTVIDSKATFVRGANLRGSTSQNCEPDCIDRLDDSLGSSTSSPYLEHKINRVASSTGQEVMAEIRVEFFQTGTQTPVTISGLVAHFYDVDHRQSVEVDGVQSYSLAPNTILTTTSAQSGALRFSELNDTETTSDSPTLSAYTLGRATVTFSAAPAVTYRLYINADNPDTTASFDVDFSAGVPWLDTNGPVAPTITPAPPSLSPSIQVVTGISGCPLSMSAPLASNFGGAVSYVSTSGTSPAGLAFVSTSGVFSGTPTAVSTSTVNVTGTGSVSGSATSTVVFNVTDAAMTLAPSTQTVTGTTGTAITPSNTLAATTNCSNVSYSITSGTLPAGLTLNASTGAVTGTPTAASTDTITITATDTAARTATSTVTFNVTSPSSAQLPGLISPPTPSPTTPPTTTVAPPTTTAPSTTTLPPTTTTPAAPVPASNGNLPALDSGETLVTENGQPITVELVVENDEALVLRSQDFELRLRGACTTGCTITEDTTGRETIHLDRSGGARVSGFGFLPGSLVHVWIFSEPRYLGALLVAPDGTYEGTFPLDDIEVGGHTLQANGFSFDNVPRSANLGIVVVDTAVPTPGPTALPATGTNTSNVALWAALLALLGGITLTSRRTRHT